MVLKSARSDSGLPTSKPIEAKKFRALREGAAYLIATRQAGRALSAGCRAPIYRLAGQDGPRAGDGSRMSSIRMFTAARVGMAGP